MNTRRLPIAFLVLGLAFKTCLVLLWRLWSSGALLNLLIYYDPVARYFAEKVTRLFFDYGGITLTPGANAFFDVVLIIGFGIECLLAASLLRWLLGRFQGQQPDEGLTSAHTKPGLKPSH